MEPPPTHIVDLTGHQFGLFTVESYSHVVEHPAPKQNEYFWNCVCACGRRFQRSSASIRRSRSCGCLNSKNGRKLIQRLGDGSTYRSRLRLAERDFTGLQQGLLTVVERQPDGRWRCVCDCGQTCELSPKQIIRGVKSCGCLRSRKAPGEASFAEHYRRARQAAERRGLEFDLTHEEFREIISRNCVYCDAPPAPTASHEQRFNGAYPANSLDRLNYDVGFNPDNVVSCCATCRRARNGRSLAEFKAYIKRLLDRFSPHATA